MNDDLMLHHFAAIVERLDQQTRVIAEGHQLLAEKLTTVDQRLDRLQAGQARLEVEVAVLREDLRSFKEETRFRFDAHDARFDAHDARFDSQDARFDILEQRQQAFEAKVMDEFRELKAMIKFSFAELDRRISTLEGTVHDLLLRVERLEAQVS